MMPTTLSGLMVHGRRRKRKTERVLQRERLAKNRKMRVTSHFFLILTLMSENSKELFGLGNLWLWVDVL